MEPGALVRAAFARYPGLPALNATYVVAAGKAALPMFAAAAGAVRVTAGLVSTHVRNPDDVPATVEIFNGGHPAPNGASVAAGERALALAHESASHGGLLVLLSGGASAMLAVPAARLTLGDKLETSRQLMAAGAPIDELNCVRKHLSRIKGGRLAAAARTTVTFALSDVHGPVADDPSVIASGPTAPDVTTFGDALDVIRARAVAVPPDVVTHLERGRRGEVEETIKPGDPRIRESLYNVIGNRQTAVNGARRAAEARGYRVLEITPATRGEARDAGRTFVEAAARAAHGSEHPLCVIGSGETTVTVTGDGLGGRNQEFAIGGLPKLAELAGTVVLGSAGTDGIDGPTDAAGAVVDETTVARARAMGLDAGDALNRNDAYRFFASLGDLIVWGPTGTNVGDVHVLLVA